MRKASRNLAERKSCIEEISPTNSGVIFLSTSRSSSIPSVEQHVRAGNGAPVVISEAMRRRSETPRKFDGQRDAIFDFECRENNLDVQHDRKMRRNG